MKGVEILWWWFQRFKNPFWSFGTVLWWYFQCSEPRVLERWVATLCSTRARRRAASAWWPSEEPAMKSPAISRSERLCLFRVSLQAKRSLTARNASLLSIWKHKQYINSIPICIHFIQYERRKWKPIKLERIEIYPPPRSCNCRSAKATA